jgi:glycine/D-amino acid oxidase-like deaminating enzyme
MKGRNRIEVDVAVVGGGIAGLWLLNLLIARGYRVILLEREALGSGQTLASQGVIHGGLKYALSGVLTSAAQAIAAMPSRWRDCIAGSGEIDLRGVRVLSSHYYLWANDTRLGQLGSFLASKLLRGRVRRLDATEFPPPFDTGFAGSLYELDELVLDVSSLLEQLAAPHAAFIGKVDVSPESLIRNGEGDIVAIESPCATISADTFVFTAGQGNGALLEALPGGPTMQLRPLHQVLVEHPALPVLYAHCVAGLRRPEPRLTVTTHQRADGGRCWYLGGQLATDGASRDGLAQQAAARAELTACIPWLDLQDARLRTLRVDRAEPHTPMGVRPDEAFVARHGRVITVWPTKLSLAPDMGDKVLTMLARPAQRPHAGPVDLPPVPTGVAPWQ